MEVPAAGRAVVGQLAAELRQAPLTCFPCDGEKLRVVVDGLWGWMFNEDGGWSSKLCITYDDGQPPWKTKYVMSPDADGRFEWGHRGSAKQAYIVTARATQLEHQIRRLAAWKMARLLFLAARDSSSWVYGISAGVVGVILDLWLDSIYSSGQIPSVVRERQQAYNRLLLTTMLNDP